MRSGIALVACLLCAVGCGVDRERAKGAKADLAAAAASAEEPSHETFAIGTAVSADGAVPKDAGAENFVRGGEVYVSVNVQGASTDQTIEVKWLDPSGQVLRRDARRAPHGTHYVPFSSGATSRWPRGRHRAVIFIDGRAVSEKPFAVL